MKYKNGANINELTITKTPNFLSLKQEVIITVIPSAINALKGLGQFVVMSCPSLLNIRYSSSFCSNLTLLKYIKTTSGTKDQHKGIGLLNKRERLAPSTSTNPIMRFQRLSLFFLFLRNKVTWAIDGAVIFTRLLTKKVMPLINLPNTKSTTNILCYYLPDALIVSQHSLAIKEISFLLVRILCRMRKK